LLGKTPMFEHGAEPMAPASTCQIRPRSGGAGAMLGDEDPATARMSILVLDIGIAEEVVRSLPAS